MPRTTKNKDGTKARQVSTSGGNTSNIVAGLPLKIPCTVTDPQEQFYWEYILAVQTTPLTVADLFIVKTTVDNLIIQDRIVDTLKREELLIATAERGSNREVSAKANPLMVQLDRVNTQLIRLFEQLGLSPKARLAVAKTVKILEKDDDTDEDDEI